MKYFLIILFIISSNLFAEEFSWDSTSVISKVHETSLPNGEKHIGEWKEGEAFEIRGYDKNGNLIKVLSRGSMLEEEYWYSIWRIFIRI